MKVYFHHIENTPTRIDTHMSRAIREGGATTVLIGMLKSVACLFPVPKAGASATFGPVDRSGVLALVIPLILSYLSSTCLTMSPPQGIYQHGTTELN